MMSSNVSSYPATSVMLVTSREGAVFKGSPKHLESQGRKTLLAAMASKATPTESRAPIFASAASVGYSLKASPEMKSATVSPALAMKPTIARTPEPMPAGGGQPKRDATFEATRMPNVLPATRAKSTTNVSAPKESTCTPALTTPKLNNTTKSTKSFTDSSNACKGDAPFPWCFCAGSCSAPYRLKMSDSMCNGMNGTMKTSAKDGCKAA
mmetsp:Transcript_49102/g.137483  ORF Transcript_49102/g.137483 Transcript_49102/m.137483 type:complete len:210 (+) Transcript_49102:334-963(+)